MTTIDPRVLILRKKGIWKTSGDNGKLQIIGDSHGVAWHRRREDAAGSARCSTANIDGYISRTDAARKYKTTAERLGRLAASGKLLMFNREAVIDINLSGHCAKYIFHEDTLARYLEANNRR